jgi:circadian clock protein KaiC
MTDRLSSGSDRLDGTLGGGFMANAINFILGPPGSGKTILAQQYLFHNATEQHPGVYFSTVSEPLEKILRYAQTLTFFDGRALGKSVLYEDLGGVLNDKGLPGILARVTEVLREQGPSLIVIDSFKATRSYADGQESFRHFLHELAGRVSAYPVTSFWIGEYDSGDIIEAPEFAVADAIVSLSSERRGERESRSLQVLKLRGSDYQSGLHAYRLSESGLQVFPRMADPVDPSGYGLSDVRVPSGIPVLDAMLEDGFWPGASTLVAGPSGSGKTLLGLHFVFSGLDTGEPGLLATMQENPSQLERIANRYSWSFRSPGVELMYRTPVDLYLDEWVYDLLGTIERTGVRRVVIDSLGDLRAAAADDLRFREYIYSLLQRCSRQGVSVILTQEMLRLFGVSQVSEYGVSHLSDNVVLLQFVRGNAELRRSITVLKTRASTHDPRSLQFDITTAGFVLGEPLSSSEALSN